jgi:hypothetical protein
MIKQYTGMSGMSGKTCCVCNYEFFEGLNSTMRGLMNIHGVECFICDSCIKAYQLEDEDIKGFLIATSKLNRQLECGICKKTVPPGEIGTVSSTEIDGHTYYVCAACMKEHDRQPGDIRGFFKARRSSAVEHMVPTTRPAEGNSQNSSIHEKNNGNPRPINPDSSETRYESFAPRESSITRYRRDDDPTRSVNTTISVDSGSVLQTIEATKSYTGKALLSFIFYYIGFFIIGFIMNLVYLSDAKKTMRITGTSPSGRGCLQLLLFVHIILPIVLILILTGVITTEFGPLLRW